MIEHSFQVQMTTCLLGSLLAVIMAQSFNGHPGKIETCSDADYFDENYTKTL